MTDDLYDVLLERIRSAAFSPDAGRRAWEAVRTAKLLRADARHAEALDLLDDVVQWFEHPGVVRGAYACAVAIHCDLGNPSTGITVGRQVWDDAPAPELGRALARVYWERFQETGLADDREVWRAFKAELEAVEASAA